MTKLFILGITGYVGGDTVYAFTQAHPEWEMTALVRSTDKGAAVAKEYPAIKLVYGDLDNGDLLADESSKADIVLQLADADNLGTLPADTHVYDDWDGRVDLYARTPPNPYHKPADLAVTHAGQRVDGAVRCALVTPPAIYGTGRGPCHRHSMLGHAQVRIILTEGAGCLLGDGGNIWNVLHVSDVGALLILLVEAAVQGGGKADWDHDAYYLCEAGEMKQREMVEPMAKEAARMGLIASPELKTITRERANEIVPYGEILMGSTSRGRSIRARRRLGWEPKGRSWAEELPDLIETVAREMGLWKSHAQKAAGR
ncbi:hypothetical protein B0A49_13103 [Cryomyces minteri]|uniref:Uncharacterized protein n=1 Tax=Cryomyces minteri TaxID=331657 RepID=A0A4U0VYA3_9PEZI|nr:hypothetical protein B0A49_13103 [Cryomyces minteri]